MNAKSIIEFINDYQNGNEYAIDLLKKQAMSELEASTAKCPQLLKARQGKRGHDLSNTIYRRLFIACL